MGLKYNKPSPTEWRANGKIELYYAKVALEFLDYCRDQNIGILGFEGFIKSKDGFMPDINWIADFSDLYKNKPKNYINESIEISKKILENAPENILFEFILTSPISPN